MNNRWLIFFVFITSSAFSQRPAPAPAQKDTEPFAINGGTLHIGNGKIIPNATVLVEKGKVVYAGEAKGYNRMYRTIDASGKHIYPGLIAPNTELGLVEVEAVRSTRDMVETGDINPNVRSLIAYNTDSEIIPTVRSNGVLLAQICPYGGTFPGTSSIVQLDAWNWEDAAYHSDAFIHLNWPRLITQKGWWGEPEAGEKNEKYKEEVRKIHDFLKESKAYSLSTPREENLKLLAMKGLFDKSKKLLIYVGEAREILDAISLKNEYDIDIVIVGAKESWKVTSELKALQIPVILTNMHTLPTYPEDDIDIVFRTPAILQSAGIKYCLSLGDSWQVRNLPFIAGSAVAYGLEKEQALRAITLSTAEILGIADKAGSIEVGKDANIIISAGDLLDMRTSKIEKAFIQGREINLSNKQTELYNNYKLKYENQKP